MASQCILKVGQRILCCIEAPRVLRCLVRLILKYLRFGAISNALILKYFFFGTISNNDVFYVKKIT